MLSELIEQDILEIKGGENLIVQQTNCNAVFGNGKGLASEITTKWSHVTPYHRKEKASMGSIQLFSSMERSPVVCCLNAQMYVGRKQAKEDYHSRHEAFRQALTKLAHWLSMSKEGQQIKHIYFPQHIGCGLARGDWNTYLHMIDEFANSISIPCYRCIKNIPVVVFSQDTTKCPNSFIHYKREHPHAKDAN